MEILYFFAGFRGYKKSGRAAHQSCHTRPGRLLHWQLYIIVSFVCLSRARRHAAAKRILGVRHRGNEVE
jgi:hypothetical protein